MSYCYFTFDLSSDMYYYYISKVRRGETNINIEYPNTYSVTSTAMSNRAHSNRRKVIKRCLSFTELK